MKNAFAKLQQEQKVDDEFYNKTDKNKHFHQ